MRPAGPGDEKSARPEMTPAFAQAPSSAYSTPGGADEEGRARLQAQELPAHLLLRGEIGDVEQHDFRARRLDRRVHVRAGERREIDEPDALHRLLCEMQGDIRLVHRGDGVARHHGVAVDAIGPALIGGEQMAEGGVTLELRRADDEGHKLPAKAPGADVERAADAADLRARIEGRADLVMTEAGAEALEPCEGLARDSRPSRPGTGFGWSRQGRSRGRRRISRAAPASARA